jgi:hypothetical protein
MASTVDWHRENAGWVDRVRSGPYREYYALNHGGSTVPFVFGGHFDPGPVPGAGQVDASGRLTMGFTRLIHRESLREIIPAIISTGPPKSP